MKKYIYILTLLSSISLLGQDTVRQFFPDKPAQLMKEYLAHKDTQKPIGYYKEYAQNGTLKMHTEFNNGLLWNVFIVHDSNNVQIFDFGTFKNGTGTLRDFRDKETTRSLRSYKDGVLHGRSIKYYANGSISMQGNYNNGNRCGTWYKYTKNGTLKENGAKKFGQECPFE
jgi:antitoxin component YwqK of YwqJK toxin-antitoxin module